MSRKSYGEGARGYVLFAPESPKAAQSPVVVFLHGWGAMQPAGYLSWINHIVRKGNIVIYPCYQVSLLDSPREFQANAIAAVKDALQRLRAEPGHPEPDTARVSIVGHSMGGFLATNLAAAAAGNDLPQPLAVMSDEPGNGARRPSTAAPMDELSKIPPQTLLLIVVGEEDRIAGEQTARTIFDRASRVPSENKNFIRVRSDSHGRPTLAANHFFPCAGARWGVDALDYYGTWKLFDGLRDAAFYHRNREYALGGTSQQRFMGVWSDGVAVRELEILAGSGQRFTKASQ